MHETELVIVVIILFIMLLPVLLITSFYIWFLIAETINDLIKRFKGGEDG